MKAAKEMFEFSKVNRLPNKNLKGHYFTPREMQDFIIQLCKEQRKICLKELEKNILKVYQEKIEDEFTGNSILNAPKPEL